MSWRLPPRATSYNAVRFPLKNSSVVRNEITFLLVAALHGLSACAGTPVPAPEAAEAAEIVQPTPEPVTIGANTEFYSEAKVPRIDERPYTAEPDKPFIDRAQASVHGVVRGSSRWFDGFFGANDADADQNVRQGSVRLGALWDQRDGVRGRARLRARLPLPAFRERTRLILGRGDFEDYVGGTAGTVDTLPSQFQDFQDDDWLLGVGFSRDGSLSRGFDVDVGVKLATPLEPYVRGTYRWSHSWHDAWLWRLRPRVFWQNQRGPGASLNSIVDYAANPEWLLRSWITLSGEDEIEGVGWIAKFIAYQSLTNKAALSYTVFASGETENDVRLQDYGLELRYRKRIAREYLFMELSTSLTWPRYLLAEQRDSNFGVGLEFEMQFGDWPGR